MKLSVIGNRGGRHLRLLLSGDIAGNAVSVIGSGGYMESGITFPYTGPETIDQQNLVGPYLTGNRSIWQSFTAGADGYLSSWETYHNTSNVRNFEVARIYRGEGTGGEILYNKSNVPMNRGRTWYRFRPEYAVELTAGQKYTIYYYVYLGPAIGTTLSNSYPGGRASLSASHDFMFRTYMPDT